MSFDDHRLRIDRESIRWDLALRDFCEQRGQSEHSSGTEDKLGVVVVKGPRRQVMERDWLGLEVDFVASIGSTNADEHIILGREVGDDVSLPLATELTADDHVNKPLDVTSV
jgi:hypothetical protein